MKGLLFLLGFLVLCTVYYNMTEYEYFENNEDTTKDSSEDTAKDVSEPKNVNEENKQEYIAALSLNAPASQPVQGPEGPAGPPGPPGGTFVARGSLLNVANPSLRLDRLYGSGANVVGYLAPPNYRSHQTWTIQSDNQLANQFGGCLRMDPKTEQVYISACQSQNPDPEQMWNYDLYGRISNKSDNNLCLEVSSSLKTEAMRGTIENNQRTGGGLAEGTQVLTVGDCSNQDSQAWYFN